MNAIVITTFLRDNYLYNCINSIRKYYPKIEIFIADCGYPNPNKDDFCKNKDCHLFTFPFNCGVSESRNLILENIPKKYKNIFLIDDDTKFNSKTNLEYLNTILEYNKKIDSVHIKINDKNGINYYPGNFEFKKGGEVICNYIKRRQWKYVNKNLRYIKCDFLTNQFLFRRNNLEWDPDFKGQYEHLYHSLKWKNERKYQVYTDSVEIEHGFKLDVHPEFKIYKRKNSRLELLLKKLNLNIVIN